MDKKAIGEKIKEIRLNQGLTLEEFGKQFEADKSNVRKWENGTSLPNKSRLKKIADLIGMPVNEFVSNHTGEKIKEIRLGLGETMEEFGTRFNTSKGTVNNWEKGRNLPNRKNMKMIAEMDNQPIASVIGKKIKLIRQNKGLTLKEFGEIIDAPLSAVSNWEQGLNLPNKKRLKQIAEIEGQTVVSFVESSNHLGTKIKEIRLSLGENLETFAARFDANRGLVSAWENGRFIPNPKRLLTIAKLGGMTVEQLLYENPLAKFSTDELVAELERRKP